MATNKKKYIEISCHVIFWVFPAFLMIRFRMVQFGNELNQVHSVVPFLVNTFLNAVLVYINILYLFRIFREQRITRFFYIVMLGLLVLLGAIAKVAVNNLSSLYFTGVPFKAVTFNELFLLETVIAVFFMVQSVLYCMVKEWIKNSIVNRKLNEEKLSLELKYLKSQINPHFLFNTLNNLYSMALTNRDEETADGISRLSQIMRYMLNDANEREIFFDKEMEYLQSYIALQRLRFSETDDIEVTFRCKGNTAGIRIPPFLFIVFIENAFKYGVDYTKHSFVDINFDVQDKAILFAISNSVHRTEGIEKHGIGLTNIRDRLQLLYPGSHSLEIKHNEHVFAVKLEIKR